MNELILPWPPSVNTYWRSIVMGRTARVLVSAQGRAYQQEVAGLCLAQRANKRLSGRLSVEVWASPPDRRKRDIDNIAKSLLDSLTKAGVWMDDEQIDELIIRRQPVIKGGEIRVRITASPEVIKEAA